MQSAITINPNFPEQSSPPGRLYFLDNLRTFIILLVVAYHAAYAYMINPQLQWIVVDQNGNPFFDIFILNADVFMMPVMFFIAGYFGIRSLVRKGQIPFWQDKIYRIIIPWALGVIFLAPATTYIYFLSRNLYPAYLYYCYNFFFSSTHTSYSQLQFWFLGTLTLFYLILSIVYHFYKPLGKINNKLSASSVVLFMFFGLGTSVIAFMVNLFFNDFAFKSIGVLYVIPTRLIPYLCYFFLGVYGYKQQWFTAAGYNPKLKFWFLMSMVLLILFDLFFILTLPKNGLVPIKAVNTLLRYLFSLCSLLFLLAFFQKRINFTTQILNGLSLNSYLIYFVHLFIVLMLNLAIKTIQLNVFLKFLLVWILSVAISYFLSKYILSKTPCFRITKHIVT